MIELAKHIEVLLLENDCVILPGFGGFITYYTPAKHIEEEGLFLPPVRIVGFNPQLKINDGLLVQSYMETYDTDFSDATHRVEEAVNKLITLLHEEGKAEIHGVGEIRLTIDGAYLFTPNEDGVFTPSLYGLSSFELGRLKTEEKKKEKILYPEKSSTKVYEIKINPSLLKHTAAIAAAILLFLFLSPSVENTYIEEENYAMIGSEGLFESIRDKSVTSTIVQVPQKVSKQKKNSIPSHLRPKAVRTEKVIQVENKNIQVKNKNIQVENKKLPDESRKAKEERGENSVGNRKAYYNIIVASIANETEAQKIANRLQSQGYPEARVIKGDGKIRVSLLSLESKSEAYKTLNRLRQEEAYKTAWLLTTQ